MHFRGTKVADGMCVEFNKAREPVFHGIDARTPLVALMESEEDNESDRACMQTPTDRQRAAVARWFLHLDPRKPSAIRAELGIHRQRWSLLICQLADRLGLESTRGREYREQLKKKRRPRPGEVARPCLYVSEEADQGPDTLAFCQSGEGE